MDNSSKRKLDKFYTNKSTASSLIDKTCDILKLDKSSQLFLEPSAGGGAFSSQLRNVIAYDLFPEADGVLKQDFLSEFTIPDAGSRIPIGNPPFGKRAKLALEFLNKCGRLCGTACFILPSTFRRWSVQSKVENGLRLIHDEDLPLDSFEFDGKPYSLNCVFQIWSRDRRTDLPDLRLSSKPPISHPDFQMWQYNGTDSARKYLLEDWDIATYRQGYKDYSRIFMRESDFDEVKNIVENTSIQIMFIKFNNDKARHTILRMDLNKLANRNLSTPGFGKSDFVNEYGKYL